MTPAHERRALSSRTASARLVAAAVLIAALVTAGCTEQEDRPTSACASPVVRGTCASVDDGGRQWRYALLRAARPTERTVLVDFGGPGLAVLAGNGRLQAFRDAYPRLADRVNLLAIEEPWVRRVPSPACEAALRHFLRDLRDHEAGSAARDLRRPCDLSTPGMWGFDPTSFRSAVRAVTHHERLRLEGFVGMSFGSVRLAYLTGGPHLAWSVLVRPFPVGATGTEVIASRADGTAAMVRASGTTANASGTSRFDMLSALVELGYVDDRQAADVLPRVLSDDQALARTLANKLWQTYGDGDVSPGFLSYLDEICWVAAPWPTTGPPAGDTLVTELGAILTAAHRPCGDGPPSRQVATGTDRMCVVVSATDPVASAALVERQYAALRQVRWVRSPMRSHSSLDGLDSCLDQVTR